MDFIKTPDRIFAEDPSGALLAEITFPQLRPGVVNISHTFVDGSLRGQGVADALMRAALTEIRARGAHTAASCSYAAAWFARHPEEADVLLE